MLFFKLKITGVFSNQWNLSNHMGQRKYLHASQPKSEIETATEWSSNFCCHVIVCAYFIVTLERTKGLYSKTYLTKQVMSCWHQRSTKTLAHRLLYIYHSMCYKEVRVCGPSTSSVLSFILSSEMIFHPIWNLAEHEYKFTMTLYVTRSNSSRISVSLVFQLLSSWWGWETEE